MTISELLHELADFLGRRGGLWVACSEEDATIMVQDPDQEVTYEITIRRRTPPQPTAAATEP